MTLSFICLGVDSWDCLIVRDEGSAVNRPNKEKAGKTLYPHNITSSLASKQKLPSVINWRLFIQKWNF